MRRKYNKRKLHETRPVSQVKKFSNQAEYDLKNPAYCRCAYSLVRLCMTQVRSTSNNNNNNNNNNTSFITSLPTPHCLFLCYVTDLVNC